MRAVRSAKAHKTPERTSREIFKKLEGDDIISESESSYVIVRPLSTVGYTSVVASVIHSRQWSN